MSVRQVQMANPFKVVCATAGLHFTVAVLMKHTSARVEVVGLRAAMKEDV